MSQQNINQYNYKRWFITQHKPIFDISLASDERDYNEEVVFSNQIIGINDGNRLPIHFDLNNSGSSRMFNLNYGDYNTGNTLVSLNYYNPNNDDLTCYTATSLCDIGLTGIDNGLTTQISGETLYYTMGLFTGDSKWDRYHYDRRMKLIPVLYSTNEVLDFTLVSQISPGSVIVDYLFSASTTISFDASINFSQVIDRINDTPILITTGVTILSGYFTGTTRVVIQESFSSLTQTSSFSGLSISGVPYTQPTVLTDEIIFETPIPTPTPTPTPTQSVTPTVTRTQTPTPSTTNPCVQFITDETGNLIITENGNYIISELNPCVTPTPTRTPTQTRTPTPTQTPTNTVTPTNTPSVTQTMTPTPSQEPLYPLTLYIQPLSGGQSIIFDGETYTEETTVNISLNTFYNIEADPIPGYMFIGWNIYGGSFSSTGQSTTVSISLTSGANLAPSYDIDPNYDALEEQLTTSLVSYQNATDNNWVSITQQEYNNIFNNVDGVIKIGNDDTQINTRAVATGFDTTTFGTTDADTPLTIPTGYYVVGFIAESWNQNGQVQLGYTTTYHTGSPTYMGNSPNVIGGTTMFYVRKRPSGVEGAPSSTNLYPVLDFLSPAYPNAVPNTYGWQTGNGGTTWAQTDPSSQTAKIQILLTNTVSWPT